MSYNFYVQRNSDNDAPLEVHVNTDSDIIYFHNKRLKEEGKDPFSVTLEGHRNRIGPKLTRICDEQGIFRDDRNDMDQWDKRYPVISILFPEIKKSLVRKQHELFVDSLNSEFYISSLKTNRDQGVGPYFLECILPRTSYLAYANCDLVDIGNSLEFEDRGKINPKEYFIDIIGNKMKYEDKIFDFPEYEQGRTIFHPRFEEIFIGESGRVWMPIDYSANQGIIRKVPNELGDLVENLNEIAGIGAIMREKKLMISFPRFSRVIREIPPEY